MLLQGTSYSSYPPIIVQCDLDAFQIMQAKQHVGQASLYGRPL